MRKASSQNELEATIIKNAVGKIPSHWEVYKVKDLIEAGIIEKIQDGNHGGSHPVSSDYVTNGVPFIMSGDVRNGQVDTKNCKFITAEHASSLRVGHSKMGDVLLTHKGNDLGRAGILKDVDYAVLTPQVTYYRVLKKEILAPEFLLCYFFSPNFQYQFKRDAHQSTRPFVSISNQGNLYIVVPPLPEQNSIIRILSSISNKIELNRRINQTLEEMAQAIFKSWFVDFDPVKAKIEAKVGGEDPERAAMCAISGKTDAELDQLPPDQLAQLRITASLFPDELIDSELGPIPKGWKVKTIDELSYLVGMGPFGSNIKVSTFVGEGIPVISGKHLNGTLLEDIDYNFITEEHAQKLKNSNVYRGDIIFTHAGNIGQVAYIPDKSQYERYVLSQRQFYMRPDVSQISPLFIVYYFRSPSGQHTLLANTSQVGVPSISRPVSYLRTIRIVPPPKKLSDIFDQVVRPLHDSYCSNTEQQKTLSTIRDALLPMLLSGKITIKDEGHR